MNSNTPDNLDPVALKAQLDNTLGENKEQYWKHVQSFVQGKINRMELDFWANLFLPKGCGIYIFFISSLITFGFSHSKKIYIFFYHDGTIQDNHKKKLFGYY